MHSSSNCFSTQLLESTSPCASPPPHLWPSSPTALRGFHRSLAAFPTPPFFFSPNAYVILLILNTHIKYSYTHIHVKLWWPLKNIRIPRRGVQFSIMNATFYYIHSSGIFSTFFFSLHTDEKHTHAYQEGIWFAWENMLLYPKDDEEMRFKAE